jgi:capsule polysaccharide export protein KpsE/RkpR
MSKAAAKLKVAPSAADDPKPQAEIRARQVRRERARRLARLLALFVGVPTLLAIVYYGFWAAPQYESVAAFAVHASQVPGLDGKTAKRASSKDALLVREYIRSRSMLAELVKSEGFIETYQDARADRWSRLGDDASSEELYDYYLERVTVNYNSAAETLDLTVRAYSGEQAQALGHAILASAEAMVNGISKRASDDAIKNAAKQVEAAKVRVAKARRALPSAPAPALEDPNAETAKVSDATLQPALLERELAERSLETALTSLKAARVAAARNQRYLVTIAAPSLSTGSTYPKRAWGIATVSVVSFMLMGVLLLLGAAIREHAKF